MKKYREIDKSISKEIMKDFKGETTEVICPRCKGSKCKDCNHKGVVVYEW